VVLGGGAILPSGIASGMIAIFRSEGGSLSIGLVGDGGAIENDGAGGA